MARTREREHVGTMSHVRIFFVLVMHAAFTVCMAFGNYQEQWKSIVNRKHVLKTEMAAVIAEDARIHASALKDVQIFWGQDSAET